MPIGSALRLYGGGAGKGVLISADSESVAEIDLTTLDKRLRPGMTLMLPCELRGLDAVGLPVKLHQGVPRVQDVSAESGGHVITLEKQIEGDETQWRERGAEGAGHPELAQSLSAAASRHLGKVVFIDPDPRPAEDSEAVPDQYRVWLASLAPQLADETDSASLTRCDRSLDQHLSLAAKAVHRLTQALGLPAGLSAEIIEAARQHDLGKAELRWQRALGNPDPTAPLAKSSHRNFDIRLNDGYRHELGSLRGQMFSPLTAHLIAAHHGWSRPLFTEKALRKSGCREPGEASPGRFAELQTRYGWWGLAYLEAVVRCADVLAEVLIKDLEADPECN